MLGGADNPNGELLSYIIGADSTDNVVKNAGPDYKNGHESEIPHSHR